jgi:hypothetical protein
MVGNKCDLSNRIVVTDNDISDMAHSLNIDFVKTSVINCHNINYIFDKIACNILHNCKKLNKIQFISNNNNPSLYSEKYGIRYNHKEMDTLEFNNDDKEEEEEKESKTCGCVIS